MLLLLSDVRGSSLEAPPQGVSPEVLAHRLAAATLEHTEAPYTAAIAVRFGDEETCSFGPP